MAKIKLTKSAVKPQARAVEVLDTVVPGLRYKVSPVGHKVFMLLYHTYAGEHRQPFLCQKRELTVEQARVLAQEWLAEVPRGGEPSGGTVSARKAPTMKEYCTSFIEDYSKLRNKPNTQHGYRGLIDRNIIPILGRMKVPDVQRPDVAELKKMLAHMPADGDRTLRVLRNMLNLDEVWALHPDTTNPCRHVPMFPPGKETRLIVDGKLVRILRHLEHKEAEGLENYVIPLGIRLQFQIAVHRTAICPLALDKVVREKRRVIWPDSKKRGITKSLSEEARLLSRARRRKDCPCVLPSPNDPTRQLTFGEHYGGWIRVLRAAGERHVGTQGIRHRSTTDIAISGGPTKVGMALTAHKTVAILMHYVHTEYKPVRDAAELVANRRQAIRRGSPRPAAPTA
uniref:Putative site specific recombinase n=1 Tax=Pseudomonas extremaustralis TaxID=359110 RepID=A0AEF7_9PSED|nr:putative site specific recombinase [Pseudomonas extremaustralis 14-3]